MVTGPSSERTVASISRLVPSQQPHSPSAIRRSAQKRKLDDLTTLSTITVVLLGPQAAAEKPARPETGFLAGLKGGWRAFVASMVVLLTILGALLPWFLAIGVPVFAALWFIRRARRRPVRAPLPPEPAAEAPPATG